MLKKGCHTGYFAQSPLLELRHWADILRRWPSLLPESFKSQEFLNVSHDKYPSSPELRLFFTQMQCILTGEVSFVALDNSGPDKSGQLRRKHIQGATNEMKEGVAIHFILEVTIGQKRS